MLPAEISRRVLRIGLVGAALGMAMAGLRLRAQSPSVNDGFDPSANGPVNAIAVQTNGQVVFGGNFTTLQPNGALTPTTVNYLARVNSDGTLDTSFNPNPNNQIYAIVIQPNGQILIGGNFTTLQPAGASAPIARNHIARLNADGSLDMSFNPNATGALVAEVFAIALQPNGQILIGGAFTNLQPPNAKAPINQPNLARLNSDGTVDTSFNPDPLATVTAIAYEPATGQVIVGGAFTSIAYKGQQLGRNHVARFNSDGSFDYGFDPDCNGSVDEIVVQEDGKILLGGTFTSLQPDGAAADSARDNIARINADGTLDTAFGPNVSSTVNAIVLQPDGKIVLGGAFFQVFPQGNASGTAVNHLARLNIDGSVDTSFTTSANGIVQALALQPDGKIVVGGNFNQAYSNATVATLNRGDIFRANPDGSMDSTFDPDYSGRILCIAQQIDGKILLGGDFSSFGGVTSPNLARMTTAGTYDSSFTPAVNGPVDGMLVQPNGQILLWGTFTNVDGVGRDYLARINPDGTLDQSFNPNPAGPVLDCALQSNGQILIAGSFSSLRPNGSSSVVLISSFARLNADGTVDTTVNIGADSRCNAVAVQSNGQFIVVGEFTSVTPDGGTTAPNNGTVTTTRDFIARFNSDGSLDTTYDPNADNSIDVIALQPNGQAVIGGVFATFTPNGATTAVNIKKVARINTDGTVDTSFAPDPNDTVNGLSLQPDGHILITGNFITITPNAGVGIYPRNFFARINYDGSLDQNFIPNPNGNVDCTFVASDGSFYVGGGFTAIDGASLTHIAHFNPNASLDGNFLPQSLGISGNSVNTIVIQPNDEVIIGGSFSKLSGATSTNVARFNTDSAPDISFNSNTDGPVNAVAVLTNGSTPVQTQDPDVAWITATGALRAGFAGDTNVQLSGAVGAVAVQSDGSVIVAGDFSNLSGVTSNNILRLTPSGQLDSSYNPDPNNLISGMVLQPDGKLIVVGAFTQLQPNEAEQATARNYIARLNTDGSVDTNFDPNCNAAVTCVALEPNGQILIGGSFSEVDPNESTTAWVREGLARLNADGTVDQNFNPNPAGEVDVITLQPNGQMLVGGAFTSFQPGAVGNSIIRNYIARVNNDGSVDGGFDPEPNGTVSAIVLQSNGQVVFGGSFSTVQPDLGTTVVTRNNIARVNSDGSVDMSYDPNLSGAVQSLALAANGEIYAGGSFDTSTPNGALLPITRQNMELINTDGTVDASFDPAPNGTVNVIQLQPDGSLVIGGTFTQLQPTGAIFIGGSFAHVGNYAQANLALLNADGSPNTTFSLAPNGTVNALAVQANGQVLVAGAFSSINGTAAGGVARLNANTTLDTSFNPNANGTVNALAVEPSGEVLLGGSFTSVGGAASSGLALVTSSGSRDAGFTATVTGTVNALVVQSNGQILLGGSFSKVDGVSQANLARLNANGTLDTSFSPAISGQVNAIALQANGQFIVGGAFSSVNGATESDLARLNSDGSLDTSFSATADAPVTSLALEPDGKLFIGGSFAHIDGQTRFRLARLGPTSGVTQSLTTNSSFTSATWSRGGGSPELSQVDVQLSTDDVNWTDLGQASRVSGGWQISNLSLPASTIFYLRAIGIAPTNQYGSSSLIEQVGSFDVASGYTGAARAEGSSAGSSGSAGSGRSGSAVGISILGGTGLSSSDSASASSASPGRLIAFTSRANVSDADPIVTGFTISGSNPEAVLIRGIGPSLSSLGVSNPIANPTLQLFDGSGNLVASNSGWGNDPGLAALSTQVGAFPLAPGGADAATSAELQPGSYTLRVTGAAGQSGAALAEVYDADPILTLPQQIVSITSQAGVDANNALVGGFVIAGSVPQSVLIRAVGPSLAGVSNPLAAPVLALFDAQGNLLAQNAGWGAPVTVNSGYPAAGAGSIVAAAASAGAAPLPAGSSDAAVLVTLPPGIYSVEVTPGDGQPGVASLQVYRF